MNSPSSRQRLATAAIAAALAATACGVPTDSEPSALPESSLPAGLSEDAEVVVPEEDEQGADVAIFLIGEDGLESVARTVSRPMQVRDVMELLILSSEDTELTEVRQLRSAIGADTEVLGADIDESNGVLTLNFGQEGFFEITDPTTVLEALAQIVYTATDLSSVGGVLIQLQGELRPLPTDTETTDGQTPVTTADYASFGLLAN